MAKKRKKATLAEKKARPNSKYWLTKADEEWSKQIRAVGKCEHCNGTGRLEAHHLLMRKRYKFRHDLSNGVCMCSWCHKFSPQISPHQDSYSAELFLEWLETERPGQFQWYEENKHDKRQHEKTYQQCYEDLLFSTEEFNYG